MLIRSVAVLTVSLLVAAFPPLANSSRFEPLKTYEVAEGATWAQPVISGQRLFVKDVSTLTLWAFD